MLVGLGGFLDDNRVTFRRRLDEESPWWVPEPIDDRVFEKIYTAVGRFIADVGATPDHEVRAASTCRSAAFAERLKHDPEMLAKGEALKEELLDHPEFRRWIESLWLGTKHGDDRRRRTTRPASCGCGSRQPAAPRRAAEPRPELQRKVDDWVERAVGYVIDHYRSEVSDLIATPSSGGTASRRRARWNSRSAATSSSSASTAPSSAVSPAW